MPKENQLGQDKTEKPTPKRRSKARQEGQVAKSQELNSALVLLGGIIVLMTIGGWIYGRLTGMMSGTYERLGEFGIDQFNIQGGLRGVMGWLLVTLAPIFSVIAVIGIVSHVLQFGWVFSTKMLKPKFRLNPITGLKNVFNQRSLVRLAMNLVKVSLFGFIGYLIIRSDWEHFVPLMDATVGQIFAFLVAKALKIALWFLAIMLVLGIIDFAYQKWKYLEDMKMSKQEVKDERKMSEGDPKIKQKIREQQMRIAFNQMIRELPSADVVVTNPIHVAVALRYDPEEMDAPLMVGKGLRKLADRIRQIANDNDIPIVENPPLARALYKHCEIGEEIPGQFYQDVAEILAQIYQLKGDPEYQEYTT